MKLTAFGGLSLATAVAVYVLIVLGGVVSSTGSGLACPDWPLCQGQMIPALTPSVIIELTHRVWTIVVTILVISTMLFAWREYRWPSKVTIFSTLTFVLLLGQIILGMITVNTRTHPIAVTSHLAVATVIFASALTTTTIVLTYTPQGVRSR